MHRRTKCEVIFAWALSAPPTLSVGAVDATNVALSAAGAPGLYCTLETTPTLVPAEWTPVLAGAIPESGVWDLVAPLGPDERIRFYRLLVQPTVLSPD